MILTKQNAIEIAHFGPVLAAQSGFFAASRLALLVCGKEFSMETTEHKANEFKVECLCSIFRKTAALMHWLISATQCLVTNFCPWFVTKFAPCIKVNLQTVCRTLSCHMLVVKKCTSGLFCKHTGTNSKFEFGLTSGHNV